MVAANNNKWNECLRIIKDNLEPAQYNSWFARITVESFENNELTLRVPTAFYVEQLDGRFYNLLASTLVRVYGKGIKLKYSYDIIKDDPQAHVVSEEPHKSVAVQPMNPFAQQEKFSGIELDPQLNPHLSFTNYIEGDSNKLPRSVGMSIADHPNTTQFNPLFIYGPSGCGKTHLINAIGLRTKQLYPQKRVLYISARLFQVQYTNSVLQRTINDFIRFYQTIDMLIVDDIQEWMTSPATQNTFFHIFDHLFRNGKRIILASDRPPVDLQGMPERLLTRFSCGLIAELEKPNEKLCVDILENKIRKDGLKIPRDVVQFISQTANGSVRDLQGVINSLMAYSIVYNSNIDMRLAERVIKRAVKVDDKPLTVDEIVETVCNHFNVSPSAVGGKSRKRDLVVARQVSMYLAQKYTKMPASRIGKLVGNRDHSTVIHSCSQVETRLKIDKDFLDEIQSIENSFKLKG